MNLGRTATWISAVALAAVAACLAFRASAATPEGSAGPVAGGPNAGDAHKADVGLQLYSLRAQMPKDVPGTLDEVKKWGITDVEAAGTYNNQSAEDLRKELDRHGLHASGMHFQWDRLSKDLDGIIKDAKA